MNRGARREPIFHNDKHCAEFVGLLNQLPERFGLQVHGFALMPNHYHLMLESTRGELSRGLAFLQARYSLLLNRHQGWDGPLFRARFRSKTIEHSEHWRQLLSYLHLNPVRAHLVVSPEQARWTSHEAYLGAAPHLDFVYTAELLSLYGGPEAYLAELQRQLRPRVPEKDLEAAQFSRQALFGHSRGKGQGKGGDKKTEAVPTTSSEMTLRLINVEQAVAQAARRLQRKPEALRQSRSGRAADPARRVVIWWLVFHAGVPARAVARHFGISAARVSQIVKAVQQRDEKTDLQALVDAVLGEAGPNA